MNTYQQAQSVKDFCKSNSISRSLFYKLLREGNGPRTMRVNSRLLISSEAAQQWRQQMENQN